MLVQRDMMEKSLTDATNILEKKILQNLNYISICIKKALTMIKKKLQTVSLSHSMIIIVCCTSYYSNRCPASKENDWQVQGLTFFCYIVMIWYGIKTQESL